MRGSARIGVVGCGFYARNHLESWRALAPEGARLVAVCDVDGARAEAAGRDFGVPHFADMAAMADAVPLDLVDIVTRHDTHRPLAEAAIARGLAVIVQKPFATTWDDCVAIVAAAERAGTWLAVHENFRFQAPLRALRAVVASGEIGRPTWARLVFRTGFDVYAAQPYFLDEERLVIADVGVHLLDLARCLLGEVEEVACMTQSVRPGLRGEDAATILTRHAGGARGIVELSFAARPDPDPFPETLIEIEGTSGAAALHPGCRMSVRTPKGARSVDVSAPLLPWTAHPWHVSQEGAYAACRHHLGAWLRGVPADTSGADNLRTVALVEAAYRSAASRRAVVPSTRPGA